MNRRVDKEEEGEKDNLKGAPRRADDYNVIIHTGTRRTSANINNAQGDEDCAGDEAEDSDGKDDVAVLEPGLTREGVKVAGPSLNWMD